jgi:hypothetical protein
MIARTKRSEGDMAVKLYRCGNTWVKLEGHPCWKVQHALDDMGVEYEIVTGPWLGRKKREALIAGTGQSQYPAIQFEDGSWYREQSKEMARTIREGKLMEKRGTDPASTP